MYDILIKNGLIYDGTPTPPKQQNIYIKNDTIAKITTNEKATAKITINAANKIVTPGFIDIHGHSDFKILQGKTADSKIRQGITSEVIGNCGYGAFPLMGECKAHIQKSYPNLKLNWSNLTQYIEKVTNHQTAINIIPLVGHGNLRTSVTGYGNTPVSEKELSKMQELLTAEMEAGAFGFSTGLIYPPGIYSDIKELGSLAKTIKAYGGIYATHMRSEGNRLLEAITEAITIAQTGGIALQISHLKAAGINNWHKLDQAFDLIEAAQKEGVDITADRYPYTASSTELDSLLPAWTYVGGSQKEIERLKDPALREKISTQIKQDVTKDAQYWDRVQISQVKNKKNYSLEGKTIAQIAKNLQKDPIDTLIDILIEEEVQVSAIFFSMNEENLYKVLQKDYVLIGSDSSLRFKGDHFGKSHPRAYGTFPKAILLARKLNMPLEKMIYKMTKASADRLSLQKRGSLTIGAYADIVIFDNNTLADKATYEKPHQYPSGIKYVLVNGKIAIESGKQHPVFAGRVLKKGDNN